jgi:hypothetical protein
MVNVSTFERQVADHGPEVLAPGDVNFIPAWATRWRHWHRTFHSSSRFGIGVGGIWRAGTLSQRAASTQRNAATPNPTTTFKKSARIEPPGCAQPASQLGIRAILADVVAGLTSVSLLRYLRFPLCDVHSSAPPMTDFSGAIRFWSAISAKAAHARPRSRPQSSMTRRRVLDAHWTDASTPRQSAVNGSSSRRRRP